MTQPATPASVPTAPLSRLWGIDVARFCAIVGMMAAHLLGWGEYTPWLEAITSGFPSTLFAVLGGFGLVFAGRRYAFAPTSWPGIAAGIARGVVVLVLGLALEWLPQHPIAIILVYYGTAMILVAPLIYLRARWLLLLATALALLGPQLLGALPHDGYLELGNPVAAAQSVLFAGMYPALTWVVYLLIGVLLCRWFLAEREAGRSERAGAWLFIGGLGAGAVGWLAGWLYQEFWWEPPWDSGVGAPVSAGWNALLQLSTHTGSTVDLVRTAGLSVALIGLCLLATARSTAVPLGWRPIVGMGAAPLTAYTLHLLMTSFGLFFAGGMSVLLEPERVSWFSIAFVAQLLVLLVGGAYLFSRKRRGPLELLVSRVAQTAGELAWGRWEPRR